MFFVHDVGGLFCGVCLLLWGVVYLGCWFVDYYVSVVKVVLYCLKMQDN